MAVLLTRGARAPRTHRPAGPAAVCDLGRIEAFPTLSATAVRAMALINSADVPVNELAALVRRDGVMSAAVLRMANSCRFRGRVAVQDVPQAIVRIGLRECGKLVCMVGVQSVYNQFDAGTRRACDALHHHALFVASLSGEVGKALNLGNGPLAFTAGLLHDIGRVVLCASRPAEFADADPIDFREDDDTLRREQGYFGTDHCEVGHRFATHNQLPDGLARVILNHHRPAEETAEPDLVALVAVADRVANHAQREHRIAGYDLAACPAYRVLGARLTPAQDAAFRKALPGVVVRAMRETRAMLRATR